MITLSQQNKINVHIKHHCDESGLISSAFILCISCKLNIPFMKFMGITDPTSNETLRSATWLVVLTTKCLVDDRIKDSMLKTINNKQEVNNMWTHTFMQQHIHTHRTTTKTPQNRQTFSADLDFSLKICSHDFARFLHEKKVETCFGVATAIASYHEQPGDRNQFEPGQLHSQRGGGKTNCRRN